MDDPEERAVERRTQTICLMILTALAIGVGLSLLRQVLVPFVLALFFSMIVTPVTDFLQARWKLPRGLAIVSTLLLGLGIVILFVVFQLYSRSNQMRNIIILWRITIPPI